MWELLVTLPPIVIFAVLFIAFVAGPILGLVLGRQMVAKLPDKAMNNLLFVGALFLLVLVLDSWMSFDPKWLTIDWVLGVCFAIALPLPTVLTFAYTVVVWAVNKHSLTEEREENPA